MSNLRRHKRKCDYLLGNYRQFEAFNATDGPGGPGDAIPCTPVNQINRVAGPFILVTSREGFAFANLHTTCCMRACFSMLTTFTNNKGSILSFVGANLSFIWRIPALYVNVHYYY